MTDPHLVFGPERLSVQCEVCRAWPPEPHVVGLRFYCKACCECSQAPVERTGPVLGLVGAQKGLF